MNTPTKLFNPARLAAARKAAKLTQQQVAEQTGLSQPYVSALERGNLVDVEDETLAALAKVLAISPEDLMKPAEGGLTTGGHSSALDVARLRTARKAARLSQAELAQRAGVDQSYISKLEQGRVGCTLEMVAVLAKVLNVSIGYLMGQIREDAEDYEKDPRAAILKGYGSPAGLRDLAGSKVLLEELKITPDEWRALAGLAASWRDADVVPRDGWVQLLFSLRAAGSRWSADRISGEV